MDKFRLTAAWKPALAVDRLLVLSRFSDGLHRATLETAHRRDEFVAALVDEIWFAHINPGGWTEKIVERVKMWRIPFQGPTEAEKVI